MKIPEQIRIGAVDFSVEVVNDLRDGDTGLNGHILYNSSEIKVEEKMTECQQFVILWHEALHGILEQAGMGDHEESMIQALAYGIVGVLRDNPYLRSCYNN